MPSIHDTAYPRLKASVTTRDLAEVYTPTPEERTLAAELTRSPTASVCFLILLKTFQRLGYQTMAEDHARKSVGECHPYREFEGMQSSI